MEEILFQCSPFSYVLSSTSILSSFSFSITSLIYKNTKNMLLLAGVGARGRRPLESADPGRGASACGAVQGRGLRAGR